MRAVIPVAGIGVRLKPHTYTMPKVLINVAGKPILGYILDELKKLGIKRIILIIGYMGEIIKEYVDKNYNFQVDYVYQEEREGLGQAIYLAMDYLKGEPALIILGDTVFRANLNEVLKGKYSSLGVKEVENPKRFGTVELKKKFIVKLGEKLAHPPSNLAIVGIYYIKRTSLLGKCLEELIEKKIKTKGEYQLTDALQLMVNQGDKITTFLVEDWYDCGTPETLLRTNRALLENSSNKYKIKGSVIVNPVFIAKSAKILNSSIGPYVSVADNSEVVNSILKDSIINKGAKVEDVLLEQSIIGRNAWMRGKFDKINLGDSSEVDLAYQR